jgi:hypothetical protein
MAQMSMQIEHDEDKQKKPRRRRSPASNLIADLDRIRLLSASSKTRYTYYLACMLKVST